MAATSRKVALTGATGFVGSRVLAHLMERADGVRALVRDPGRLKVSGDAIEPVTGDLFNKPALSQLMQGVSAVIHLVGIIAERPGAGQTFERIHHEGTVSVLEAAREAGVGRWVQMSAIGSRADAPSRYHRTKALAEQAVRESGLQWTILRPSLIQGPEGEFATLMRDLWVKPMPPFVPYFGGGPLGLAEPSKVQPIWVEDVAHCFASAPGLGATVGQMIDLVGPDRVTWPQLYRAVRKHLPDARSKPVLPVPAWFAKVAARLPGAPFNVDQVLMSQEDNIGDPGPAERLFGRAFAGLDESIAQYADELTK